MARSGGDKVFRARVEGGFVKVVRKGAGPKSYTLAELVRMEGVPAGVRVVNLAGEALTRELRDLQRRRAEYPFAR